MKIKATLLALLFVGSTVDAATCLSKAEQKIVDKNHKNSLNSYSYINVDCNLPKMKAVCSDSYNVKMMNTMMRMNVWDEENALKIRYSAEDLVKLQKELHASYSKSSCSSLKKSFFTAIKYNGGWDY